LALIFPDFFCRLGLSMWIGPRFSSHCSLAQICLLAQDSFFGLVRFLTICCSSSLVSVTQVTVEAFFLKILRSLVFFLVASVAVSSSCTQAPVKQQGLRFSSRTMLSSTRFARHLVSILAHNYGFDFTDSAKILVFYRFGKDSCRWEVVVSD
jgi:hypothetical protein